MDRARIPTGSFLWALAGLVASLTSLMISSTGIVLLPLFLPIGVFVYVLYGLEVKGFPSALIGAILALDLMAFSLFIYPPCLVPTLTKMRDGTFVLGCDQQQDLSGLLIITVVGSTVVGALGWALVRRRKLVSGDERDLESV